MSTVYKTSETKLRIYTKGAGDIILDFCSHYFAANGEVK